MKLTQYLIAITFLISSIGFSSAAEQGGLFYNDLDESGLQYHLAGLPDQPAYKCARGVRLSLNVLFRGGPANGKNALDYNEKVLSQWQTEDFHYRKVKENRRFKNYDVKVLLPAQTCPSEMVRKYGHIEFYYDGVWYSDFRQNASAYDGDKDNAMRNSNYKRCYSAQVIYRLVPKR